MGLPNLLEGFRLKTLLRRLWASELRKWGIPSFALQKKLNRNKTHQESSQSSDSQQMKDHPFIIKLHNYKCRSLTNQIEERCYSNVLLSNWASFLHNFSALHRHVSQKITSSLSEQFFFYQNEL